MTRPRPRPSRGFTLIEMILVLVVFGLLLGGVLKTTEMINAAKVKALTDRQLSIQHAWYTFIDRYGDLPTKVENIRTYLPDLSYVRTINQGSSVNIANRQIEFRDSPAVFHHLTAAGLLKCAVCTVDGTAPPSLSNSPGNDHGGVITIFHTPIIGQPSRFMARRPQEPLRPAPRLFTGFGIASNLVAEFDRKNDDGVPNTGRIRFGAVFLPNVYNDPNIFEECLNTYADGRAAGRVSGVMGLERAVMYWRPAKSKPPVYGNCSAVMTL